MSLHRSPLACEDAVHHAVMHGPVAPREVMTDHTVLLGAKGFDRALGREIEVVGAEAHHLAAERLERVLEEQQLARGVDVAALPSSGVPGPADLDAIDLRNDVVVPRRADDGVARQLSNGPRQHVTGLLSVERVRDVRRRLIGFGNTREPQLPEAAVGRGSHETVAMIRAERLQTNSVSLERDWRERD